MNQILILTTNLSADTQLKKNLEYLGYEILCSTQLVEPLLLAKNCLGLDFPIIIFSETLTNEVVETILQQRQITGHVILRCDNAPINDELVKEWEKLGLTAQFSTEISLSNLRELLSFRQLYSQKLNLQQSNGLKISFDMFRIAINTFSSKERRLFEILLNEKGTFITRIELAYKIWNAKPTNSNLAQLSQLISRIRLKLDKYGFPEQSIETNWKKGYRVSDGLLVIGTSYLDSEKTK